MKHLALIAALSAAAAPAMAQPIHTPQHPIYTPPVWGQPDTRIPMPQDPPPPPPPRFTTCTTLLGGMVSCTTR